MTTKSAKKGVRPRYLCPTCGRETTSRGHLCQPVVTLKSSQCGHCGKAVGNLRHLCSLEGDEVAFVCGVCGRGAADEAQACLPLKA